MSDNYPIPLMKLFPYFLRIFVILRTFVFPVLYLHLYSRKYSILVSAKDQEEGKYEHFSPILLTSISILIS